MIAQAKVIYPMLVRQVRLQQPNLTYHYTYNNLT